MHWRNLWDHVLIERATYGTVALMSVLVVYRGWASLTFAGTAVVIIAPALALLLAHYFADALSLHVKLERPLRRAEWLHLGHRQLGIALAPVPPLVVIFVGWFSPLNELSTIELLLWGGVATLVFLAVVAAKRAKVTGWRVWAAGLLGGVVGLVVISLQVILKPH